MFEILAIGFLWFLIIAVFGTCVRLLNGKDCGKDTEDDREWWAIK